MEYFLALFMLVRIRAIGNRTWEEIRNLKPEMSKSESLPIVLGHIFANYHFLFLHADILRYYVLLLCNTHQILENKKSQARDEQV